MFGIKLQQLGNDRDRTASLLMAADELEKDITFLCCLLELWINFHRFSQPGTI